MTDRFLQKKKGLLSMFGGSSGDALLLTAVKLMTMLLSLVTTRLLSQYLTTYDYGTYSQVLLISSTIASITILGMMDGMNFFFCSEKDTERREAYVATIYLMQLALGVIMGAAVMLLTKPICAYMDNPELKKLMLFAAILPTLQNLIYISQVLLISVGKAKVLALRNLVISVLKLAAIIIVVHFVKDIALILIVSVLLDAFQLLIFYFILRKNGCLIRFTKAELRLILPILRYCVPMAVFVMLNTLNRDCDKYVIAAFTDTETLAVYTNASKALPIDIVMSSFITILLPVITRGISEKRNSETIEVYRLFLEISYISTAVLGGCILVSAPEFVSLLYSDKYLGGLSVFCIYILIDMVKFMSITLLLTAAGKTRILMFISLGAILSNIGLNILFYKLMGLIGPATATLAVTFAAGLLILYFSAKELDGHIRELFDLRFLIKFFAVLTAAVFLFGYIRILLEKLEMNSYLILAVCSACYLTVTAFLFLKRLMRNMKRINGLSKAKEVLGNE